MINEEVSQKGISFAVRVGDISYDTTKKILLMLANRLQRSMRSKTPKLPVEPKEPELKHGKQTLKQLHKHNEGLSSMELTDPNLRQLYQALKKDDIDFSVCKDGKGKYTLFFKGKNADEMTHAFKRYTEKMITIDDKKAIKTELKEAKTAAKVLDVGRDKEKNMSKGALGR